MVEQLPFKEMVLGSTPSGCTMIKTKKNNNKNSRPRIVLVNRCIILNEKGKLLLIKRSMEDEHAPGMWEFPGGKLDEGQDLSSALEREVLEETGLLVSPKTRIAFVESQIIPKGKYKGLPYVVLVGIGKKIGGKLKLSFEHTDYKWVSVKEAYEMEIKDEIRKALIVLSRSLRKK